MFRMMGVFAEFERSMMVERVKAGLKRARAEGKTWVGLALVLRLRPRCSRYAAKEKACGRLHGRLGSGTAPCNGL